MKREEDTPVISFSPYGGSDGSWDRRDNEKYDGRTEGDPGRENKRLSGINNGWQILRDHVQTLIMNKTQLEGGQGNASAEFT